MIKSILKEAIIVLLLCLAIILVLGILLYDYVPGTKPIPNEVAYTTPEEVKNELIEIGTIDQSEVVMTYEVNNDDLNNFKRVKDYKPGKANPFSSYTTTSSTEGNSTNASSSTGTSSGETGTSSNNTTTGTGSSNTQGTTNETTSENTTSGGHYFQDKGTK